MTKGEARGKNERGVLLHRIALISNGDSEHQSICHRSACISLRLYSSLHGTLEQRGGKVNVETLLLYHKTQITDFLNSEIVQ